MPRPPTPKKPRACAAYRRKREPTVHLSMNGRTPRLSEVKNKHIMRGKIAYDDAESTQGRALKIKKEDKKKRARRLSGVHNLNKFRPRETRFESNNVLVGIQPTMHRERKLHF